MHETDLDEVDQPRCPLVRQHSEEVCSTSEHHACRFSSPLTERSFLESVSRTQDSRPVVDERQVRQPLPFPRVLPAHRPGSCEKAVREQSRLEEGQFHMHGRHRKRESRVPRHHTGLSADKQARIHHRPFHPKRSLASSLYPPPCFSALSHLASCMLMPKSTNRTPAYPLTRYLALCGAMNTVSYPRRASSPHTSAAGCH